MLRFLTSDEPFEEVLREALSKAKKRFWCVAPFVTGALDLITDEVKASIIIDFRLVTRLHEADILHKVSDIDAIIKFQRAGGKVRFHDKSLHAKLWISDNTVYIGSVNLTDMALNKNNEIMVTAKKSDFPADKNPVKWFETLWDKLKDSELSIDKLTSIAEEIESHPDKDKFVDVKKISQGLKDLGQHIEFLKKKEKTPITKEDTIKKGDESFENKRSRPKQVRAPLQKITTNKSDEYFTLNDIREANGCGLIIKKAKLIPLVDSGAIEAFKSGGEHRFPKNMSTASRERLRQFLYNSDISVKDRISWHSKKDNQSKYTEGVSAVSSLKSTKDVKLPF